MSNEHDKDGRMVTIVVNAEEKQVPKGVLTFAQVVALADGLPTGPNILYSITYRKGEAARAVSAQAHCLYGKAVSNFWMDSIRSSLNPDFLILRRQTAHTESCPADHRISLSSLK